MKIEMRDNSRDEEEYGDVECGNIILDRLIDILVDELVVINKDELDDIVDENECDI